VDNIKMELGEIGIGGCIDWIGLTQDGTGGEFL
jgi:hypothetical protein